VFRPEPSPTPTRALYVVTALDGDDDAGGSISKEFVRIQRNEARADREIGWLENTKAGRELGLSIASRQ
jgi:hypothetical protein